MWCLWQRLEAHTGAHLWPGGFQLQGFGAPDSTLQLLDANERRLPVAHPDSTWVSVLHPRQLNEPNLRIWQDWARKHIGPQAIEQLNRRSFLDGRGHNWLSKKQPDGNCTLDDAMVLPANERFS